MSKYKEQLIEFMDTSGINQSQVARAIGKSPAVVNQYLKGTYAGNVDIVDELINGFLQRQQEKTISTNVQVDFIPTHTALRGLDVIRYAHIDNEINVIYGAAGLGKTMIMKEYAKQNANAILIETDPGYTAKALLDDLVSKLGISKRGSIHDMSNACVEALNGSEKVLLIDEAELLPYKALEALRRIHDKAQIGIVLAGMPKLIMNLKGRRGEYEQLYSRVGFALNLGNSIVRDELFQLARNFLGDIPDDVFQALFKASKGNARRMQKIMRGVRRASQLNNQPVNSKMIEGFVEMLIN